MRPILLAIAVVWLSTGNAYAEVPASQAARVAPSAAEVASKRAVLETAIADCESMWDRGTHMKKKAWSRTCRRVQDRIQQLELR
jgi:hypothetical protein